MYDPIQEWSKTFFILVEIEWFRNPCKRPRCFDDDKFVNNIVKGVEANLENVKFVKERKAIVYHCFLC